MQGSAGRPPSHAIVFGGIAPEGFAARASSPTIRVHTSPVHTRGITFVSPVPLTPVQAQGFRLQARSPSPQRAVPGLRAVSPYAFRPDAHGVPPWKIEAVDPVASPRPQARSAMPADRPMACSTWANNFSPRRVHKMDRVAEEECESVMSLSVPTEGAPSSVNGHGPSWSVVDRSGRASAAASVSEATSTQNEPPPKSGGTGGDALQLEALLAEITSLRQQNAGLREEQKRLTEGLHQEQGESGAEMQTRNKKLEQDARDMLQQFEEFEKEKAEELRECQDEIAALNAKLAEQELAMKRLKVDVERERAHLLQSMADETGELQGRIDKLDRDKDACQMELAKALARIDILSAQGRGYPNPDGLSEDPALSQLRSVQSEREALKDEVTNKDGQIILLRSQLEIADRKLRLSDMENAMLKSELELRKRSASSQV